MINPHNQVISCKDVFTMSVQGAEYSYCKPREDYPDKPYTNVECGYTSSKPTTMALLAYAELCGTDDYTETVYGWVPIEVVQAELDAHGGIVEGCMPSNEPTKEVLADIYFNDYS